MKKITFMLMAMTVGSISATAQTSRMVEQEIFVLPQFLIVILSGVLLALGFQIILTAISIASGITAMGDVRETYIKSKHQFGGKDHFNDDADEKNDSSSSTGLNISTAFGIWSLITVSLSLFAATLLAMKLVVIASVPMAITLALVIWSTFLMILFYFESRMANTLIGGLVGLATSGLKASGNTIKNLFSSSDEQKVKNLIDSSIKQIRSEFSTNIDLSQFKNTLEHLGKKVDNRLPDYDQLKNDIKEIIKESNSNNESSSGAKMMVLQQVVNEIGRNNKENDDSSASKYEKLKSLLKELKAEVEEADSTEDKVKGVARKLSPADEETTNNYVNKIFNYFKTKNSSEVSENSFQELFSEVKEKPSQIAGILSDRLSKIDRDTIVNLLNENTSYEKDQIESNVKKVEQLLQQANNQLTEWSNVDFKQKIEGPIARFFNGTSNPQINYYILKYDLKRAIDNPKDSFKIIKNRAKHFDTETFISLITANTSLEQSDIDKLKENVESTKKSILDQVSKVEEKTKLTIENAKRKAVIEAENIRKVAISAAWWLVFTALFSGAASVIGGIISL